jgi:hypothetical protein
MPFRRAHIELVMLKKGKVYALGSPNELLSERMMQHGQQNA